MPSALACVHKCFTQTPNGSFEICQERMFVKQRRKHG